MKVAVVETITENIILQFKKDGIEAIIFAKIDKNVDYKDLSQHYKLVDAYQNTTESNWYNFNLVSHQLADLRKKTDKIFTFKGYDLEEALKKDLFWAFLAPYALKFQKENFGDDHATFKFYNERSSFHKRMALMRRLFFFRPQIYKLDVEHNKKPIGNIAFRMNSVDVLPVYGNLFKKLDPKTLVTFQSKTSSNAPAIHQQLNSFFGQNIPSRAQASQFRNLPFATRLKMLFSKTDPDFLNAFIIVQNNLCNHINEYESLFRSGIKKIILNAGENEGEGNIACAVAERNGGTVFNYMNGAKARDPQNVKTNFNFWFMPDKNTQQLMLSYCDVKETQLPVTGHLLCEKAREHLYTGSLDQWLKNSSDKKIIAIFTSKIYANEKREVLGFLLDYLDRHENLLVLVRKHPAEKESPNILHKRIINLDSPSHDKLQSTLFDLLLKADVVISFSSTVSYQATWFGKPSLNYELAEKSRLSYVDDKTVFQVSSTRQLEVLLDRFLIKDEKIAVQPLLSDASTKIADIIQNHGSARQD